MFNVETSEAIELSRSATSESILESRVAEADAIAVLRAPSAAVARLTSAARSEVRTPSAAVARLTSEAKSEERAAETDCTVEFNVETSEAIALSRSETSESILESRVEETEATVVFKVETELSILESRAASAADARATSVERACAESASKASNSDCKEPEIDAIVVLTVLRVLTRFDAKFSSSPKAAANSLRVLSASGAISMTAAICESILASRVLETEATVLFKAATSSVTLKSRVPICDCRSAEIEPTRVLVANSPIPPIGITPFSEP